MNVERPAQRPSHAENRLSSSSGNRWKRIRGLIAILGFLLLTAGIGLAVFFAARPDAETLKRQARSAMLAGEYRQALDLARAALDLGGQDAEASLLAGNACESFGQYERALKYFEQIPRTKASHSLEARYKTGRILMRHLGRPSAAEAEFRSVLMDDPNHVEALKELATLLGVLSRQREAVPFIVRLFQNGQVTIDLLTLFGNRSGRLVNTSLFDLYRAKAGQDPNVPLTTAWIAWNSPASVDLDRARRILTKAVEMHPEFPPLRRLLVEVLWKLDRRDELFPHLRRCFEQPGIPARLWIIRGKLAEDADQIRPAARCYWEAYRLAPSDREAVFNLSEIADQLGQDDVANLLRDRLVKLRQVKEAADFLLNSEHDSTKPIQDLVGVMEDVGRLWEAWAWCQVAATIAPREAWHRQKSLALKAELGQCPLSQVCPHRLTIPVDFSKQPLPGWPSGPASVTIPPAGSFPEISFRDDAQRAGLVFQYFNSPHVPGQGQRMFEFPGGGCGVLDFDGDGWPDLYLTQGCQWPVEESSTQHLDRLFQNLGDGRFADVTEQANLFENRFSSGIAVGDFDNDGFQDVYVANLGENRLYHNNGDGTFEDQTLASGTGDSRWSASCVMADLNGDSLPEIYSANYLEAEDIYERICRHQDGKPRLCMPFQFDDAQDQLFLNQGDGRFQNVTAAAGIEHPNGKGLGVVAADVTGDGKLDVFVANDTEMNFLFVNQTHHPRTLRFAEEGLLRGVASNGAGKAEGCMGIAIDDADGDGRLDLFVTNFHQETNTLYRQTEPGSFEDLAREAGLAAGSRNMLGFGAQFLDADLDGKPDLITTNGHIDDLSAYGRPYRMPSQFYWNRGTGRFRELPASVLGPFFEENALGRGLAKEDWNRDGREDFVVSFLDRPAALMTNTAPHAGNYLHLQFRGTKSARDAIGVKVRLTVGNSIVTRYLVADGGYQASNQKQLTIGLGPNHQVDELEILWPSGERQFFSDVPANQELLFIESISDSFVLPLSK